MSVRDFLVDSYVRRIRWEAHEYAAASLILQGNVMKAGKRSGKGTSTAPPVGGMMSASMFLSKAGM